MSLLRLLLRSLSHYRRAHLGTLLGAALAAAILTGALAVGDSVRFSLRQRALARIGKADLALTGPGRFFRDSLADGLAADLKAPVAPLILLPAAATSSDGELRAGGVAALGVDERFFALGPQPTGASREGVALSPALARQLQTKVGEEIVLRVDKPSLLSRDAPLSTIEDATVALRLRVSAILPEAQFGEFGLSASQAPALNAFLPLATLQRAVGMAGRANTLLVGGGADPARATSALWSRWSLTDSRLTVREAPKFVELRTGSVFLDPTVGEAALSAQPGAQGVLTYFVNGLKLGPRETPYSTVAAIDSPLTKGLADDEIVINEWLAEDLRASVGDSLTLRYWVVGPQRRLEERFANLRVARIVELAGEAADPSLMPEIPGLSDKKNCREWEPGVPVDLNRIRDKDQSYWSVHRGTPKAFLALRTGQKLWNSRFGNLTAVRYASENRAAVEACIRQALSPASQGVFFQPLRERALAASGASTDFGGLFFGFSLFLLVAALLLSALLFGFSVERRRRELGVLLAFGFPAKSVRRLVLLEGGALALAGSLLGVGLATLYTRGVLAGLNGLWRGAVAGAALTFHIEPVTLLLGALGSFACALLTLFLVARRQGRDSVRALLGGAAPDLTPTNRQGGWLWPSALLMLAAGAALYGATLTGEAAAGAAFGAGSLALLGGILLCRTLLLRRALSGALPVRSAARKPGRSLAAIALLASGVFLVVAVGANQKDPRRESLEKPSGTGGFALFAESSLPIFEDLNTVGGQEKYGLDESVLEGVKFVALRLREGDEASCLNLNKAQTPRLLGVDPEALAGRFSGDWKRLVRTDPDGAIPVIGDTNTVIWLLQKKPGDTLDYTDDRGEEHRLRIAGVVPNATFQGSLILAETHFVRLFPERSGYRTFFIDAPKERVDAVRRELGRALEDTGLAAVPSGERLAAFQRVENTYLSIFAALGGLGVLLGSAGLGIIVLRNVEERRGELALLRAVGFEPGRIERLLLLEHGLLLLLGLGIGIGAGLLATLPALRHVPPPAVLPLVLLGIALSGLFWLWLAARTALRGPLLAALRAE
jgi:ABC-type antimicrobial peptide transport system permease subunit